MSHWEQPCDVRFDATLDAWVLSRYADVSAALHEARVAVQGTTAPGDAAHLSVRHAASHALTPERLVKWRTELEDVARQMVDALPLGQPVDMVQSFTEPWSLEAALKATDAPREIAEECAGLARQVFLSAASATDGATREASQDASARLARLLANANASESDAADVQTFVAMSQTLPCLLASAWLALLQQQEQLALLRAHAELLTQAVEELLRFASPARAVFRHALADVDIGEVRLRSGDRIVLLLSAANRDPVRFPESNRLDILRASSGHLAFGAGAHRCAGASMVHMAVAVATGVLISRTSTLELVDSSPASVKWIGGFAIRSPGTLPVVLQRAPVPHDDRVLGRDGRVSAAASPPSQ